jgi:outer membrane protein assembly factor BamB
MSRRCIFTTIALCGLTAMGARAQSPFPSHLVPSRTALARVGLERNWSAAVPLGHVHERVLIISLADGMLFAQTNMGNFHAYEAETGRYLWGAHLGRPTSDARAVGVNSDRVFTTNSNELLAFDRGTGQILWKRGLESIQTSAVTRPEGNNLPTSPVAADEDYVMVGLADGKLIAFTAHDKSKNKVPGPREGQFAWTFKSDAPITGRPIATERVVAFASQDKRVYVAILDQPPTMLYRYLTGGPINASMGTHGTRTLLVPSGDNNLYAIDLFTAETRWVYASGAPIKQEPLVTGDDIYMINTAGGLSALDANTGSPRWVLVTSHGRFHALSRTRVYLTTFDRDLLIVDRANGRVLADARMTHERAGLSLRDYTLTPLNRGTDRIYLATTSGMLLCLREVGQLAPLHMRDPNGPRFGQPPKEAGAQTLPPSTANPPAEESKPDADKAEPPEEPKAG